MKVSFFQPLSIYQQGKREMQEDSIFPAMGQASELDNLFIVCDGMGGHEKGEVASSTITEAVAEYFFQNTSPEETLDDQVLMKAIEYAYARLMEKVDPDVDKKPGTTLCLLYFHRGGCTAAHIGDSRIYHIRPAEGKILYKSRDHSVVYELYSLGEITEQQMLTHPRKNIITKVIMPGTNSLKPDVAHIADIQSGDYFYVCSDGMLEKMLDNEILDIFSSNISNEQKRDLLTEKTAENADNHSAYIIQIDGVMHEQRDKTIIDDEAEMMKKALPGAFAPISAEAVYDPEPPKPHSSPEPAPTPDPAPTPNPVPPSSQSDQSDTYRYSNHSDSSGSSHKKRSLVIPLLTTLVLLGALAFVLFKCKGEKATVEDNPQVVEDTTKAKKPERDTFNIVGGGETARSSDMPQPSGEKKADEQKPTEKKDESKPAQTKSEGEGTTTSSEATTTTSGIGTTNQPGQTTTPQTNTPAPTQQQNPTPAPAQQQTPTSQPEGPKPVIPDGE